MNRQNTQGSDEEILRRIRRHLQQPEAQQRIRHSMHNARLKATVTTSRVAELLDLGQQQLRDWDNRGLIKSERTSTISTEEGKQSKGHRQFSLDELDKLALIKELTDRGGITPGDLLPYIEEIWREGLVAELPAQEELHDPEVLPFAATTINQRIHHAQERLFWRFFTSHALRMALFLLREDKPHGTIGLLLPLHKQGERVSIATIDDLPALGESLVGWLNQRHFSHTLLTSCPSFDVASDFRIHPLTIMTKNERQEAQQDNTHIVVRRDAEPLTLSPEVVETVRALLSPLYADVEQIESCFGPGMYDMIDSTPAQDNIVLYPNFILNGLAEMVIKLGKRESALDYWRFCCILLPSDSNRPIQERTLVVRSQSHNSPYKIGIASVPPDLDALSLHAYQNGLVCYRHMLTPHETIIAYREVEHSINSAIAVPIGGEDGEPIGAMYVASSYDAAFSKIEDRRLLRILSRMMGELLRTYQFRWEETDRMGAILRRPDIVDEFLGVFPSENDFIRGIEEYLSDLRTRHSRQAQQSFMLDEISRFGDTQNNEKEVRPEVSALSLIGIDVDNISSHALKYGDRAVRNLYWEIDERIKGELDSTFKKYPGCQFYHIVGGRFYVLLKEVPYEQVINKARLLKKSLSDLYLVSVLQSMGIQSLAPGTLVELSITVHLAVSAYTYKTLDELFERYPGEAGIYIVREMIERSTATQLKKGIAEGGNVIKAWNPTTRLYGTLFEEI